AFVPNSGFALHRGIGCGIHDRPGLASIVRGRDEDVPGALEGCGFVIARFGGADKSDRGAIRITGYGFDKDRVVQPLRGANVRVVGPGYALVVTYGDVRMTAVCFFADPGKIECAVAGDGHRGI